LGNFHSWHASILCVPAGALAGVPKIRSQRRSLLPVIERFRPVGSTSEVLFRTTRPTVGTTKSHISHVVLDAPTWEHSVAYRLERLLKLKPKKPPLGKCSQCEAVLFTLA
jgi:hypothetical protein